MQKNTKKDALITLYNEQLEIVMNRKAGIRVLEKMYKEDPNKVLVVTPDFETMQPTPVTVRTRLEKMQETLVIDEMRLEAYEEMIEEYWKEPAETTRDVLNNPESSKQTGNSEVEKG